MKDYKNPLILIDYTADHLPLLLLVKQTKILDKMLLEFESRLLNESKKSAINEHLLNINWNKKLNAKDCNANFNTMCQIISDSLDAEAPMTKIKVSTKRRYVGPWMTRGIE